MGFKSFCKNNKEEQKKENNSYINEKQVEDIYNKYKDKNQDELFGELFKNVEKQKENGTFDYSSIENMASSLLPFLNKDQQSKLNEVLQKLK